MCRRILMRCYASGPRKEKGGYERLQGIAEGASSAPRLTNSSSNIVLQEDVESLGFTPSLAKPEMVKEIGR